MSLRLRLACVHFTTALTLAFAVLRLTTVAVHGGAALVGPETVPGALREEVRALWVVRTALTSPVAIATMVKAARDADFNTLVIQVRGRGDAYFVGGSEPRPAALAGRPTFDPLAETIARAHAAGLEVHAWVNVNLVASAVNLPESRDHVIYRHPEWMMVPRQLVDELAGLSPSEPEYLMRVARYVRDRPDQLEGIYLSPLLAAARGYVARVVGDLVERYPVDGVHLDYVRFPSEEFDYSRTGLDAFRSSLAPDLDLAELRRYDRRLVADPLVLTRVFPTRWRVFRQAQLTRLVMGIREAVHQARPTVVLSAAVVPDPVEAAEHRLQDWREWLARGVIDVVCPMAYTTDPALFAWHVSTARLIAGHRAVWAGIGAYRLSLAEIADNVHTARRLGADGVILFSYGDLVSPPRGLSYLSEVGRAAFDE